MGLRHVYGLIEAHRHGLGRVDLIALCDLSEAAATHVADEAERGLGRRPRVYTDFAAMLDGEPAIEAVNVVTDIRSHHHFAIAALRAGKHVAVEKPLAITVRAAREVVAAATRARRVLSVSENFRRDPLMRLAQAAIAGGLIGSPRLLLDMSLSGSRTVQQTTAWRHIKERGGWLLDSAVHDADIIHYLAGSVTHVAAQTALWEPRRAAATGAASSERARQIAGFYSHRTPEAVDTADTIAATSEDAAFAVVRFASGAIGQLGFSIATPGQPVEEFVIFGDAGSLALPGNRTGRAPVLTPLGGRPMAADDLLAELKSFELDDTTAGMFDGVRRPTSYTLPFAEIDRKLIAIELIDFADAIVQGREPEIGGVDGVNAVALVYAILESGHAGGELCFAAVVDDRINDYQKDVNGSIGL